MPCTKIIPPPIPPLSLNIPDELINHPVYVALSGGIDSMVLLYCLKQYLPQNQLHAIHINHQMSPNADSLQQQCKQFAKQLKIPLITTTLTIKPQTRKGIENLYREARFNKFDELLPTQAFLALGHHADDVAETILLRLTRGGGMSSWAGIYELRSYNHYHLWRPLRKFNKQQLIDYANQLKLTWIEDATNNDLTIRRNYIRSKIIPSLTQLNPNLAQTLVQGSNQQIIEITALQTLLQEKLEQLTKTTEPLASQTLVRFEFKQLTYEIQFSLIRYWLTHYQINIENSYLTEIIRQLSTAHYAEFKLQNRQQQAFTLVACKNHLSLYSQSTIKQAISDFGDKVLELLNNPNYAYLLTIPATPTTPATPNNLTQSHQGVFSTARIGAEVIYKTNGHQQPLSHWYKKKQIPKFIRKQLPLLFWGNKLFAVIGLTFFDIPKQTPQITPSSSSKRPPSTLSKLHTP